MRKTSTLQIVLSALFAALVCVATMLIHIPTPGTQGYVNLGDGIILLSAFLFSPVYAFAVGGLGSALADLLMGYAAYAPGTLVIKGLMALVACLLFRKLRGNNAFAAMLIGGVVGEIVMALGYFAFESTILGYGVGAAASIPANLVQGAVGLAVALIITPLLRKNHEVAQLMSAFEK